ncbi:acyl-CoA carboxylase subunit epsilon [Blastococcus aggregatus]|uniref:acyl-CoA carboxylase subunit epsilon n=1 Tax=Blastococcus aggregatus TaxID=38502 RepID=UPI000BE2A1F7|nr:acyl-CoA carboxylase subunit epsilon [Blastococcus aggregatus]
MTSRPSGPHRGQLPSPEGGASPSSDPGDPSGLHSGRQDQVPPLLRVVRGEPSAEELAALTVVVAALSQRRERKRPVPVGAWASYGRSHRRPVQAGPGGWRAAGSPA